ncbi:MAG: patatin-like phospholipase family protein [Cytophagales bacterium]|nr:patatin-like phospholipase family protein [Cytophagales bacterium]MDW8383590.1 patatin-like phospholipase family protein [Flammeovirgaceae bacterium]
MYLSSIFRVIYNPICRLRAIEAKPTKVTEHFLNTRCMSFVVKHIAPVFYSFPVQLLLLHFRKNIFLVAFWGVLLACISGSLGKSLGIPYLFLDPEYLNEVSWLSFFIVGIAFGTFTIVFHITSYILDSHRFSFLGTLSKPFIRFSVNNSVLPLVVMIYYIINIIVFQREYEQESYTTIAGRIIGFIAGQVATVGIAMLYFSITNRDYFKWLAKNLDKQLKKNTFQRVNVMNRIKESREKSIVVKTYYEFPFSWKTVDNEGYIDREVITRIFDQNQLNAILLQLIFLIIFLLLGVYQENDWVQIPAAASGLILFSILLMFTGAVFYWMREWSFAAVLVLIIVLTVTFQRSHAPENRALGLRYEKLAPYNSEQLKLQSNAQHFQSDYNQTIKILENWRAKFPAHQKPPMVFLCVSGGGQRSAIWTLRTLQIIDSALKTQIMKYTVLITGSSGGMIGAATYRELYLREITQGCINPTDKRYTDKMAQDKLNPIIFNMVVNDMLFHWNTYEYNGQIYSKDRGYALERKLLKDTDYFLDKKLIDYAQPEQRGLIPMMIIAPTIVNDGKKLYISPQYVSYMNTDGAFEKASNTITQIKGVEFRRMFAEQGADSLPFVSALRMSATFPYITPTTVLPSQPVMAVIDAGMSDNFGISDAVHFLYIFRNWISQNTSRVILLSIRDSQKERETRQLPPSSILGDLLSPLSNMLSNIANLQDIRNDNVITYAREWYPNYLHTVDFQYFRDSENLGKRKRSASLSWRLTTQEREHILNQVYSDFNKRSLMTLDSLLKL